jgi:hypothetical protein
VGGDITQLFVSLIHADYPLFVFYRPNAKVRPVLGIAVCVILLAAMIS